ncbi:hypothetical protein O3M35_003034 [Rhynocoris fuscipes]|uniref:Maturase K n=1 Tax=Rhynocoris fuscipes TaxID=488301 RepID=A0AAW1CQ47_9HEMI
MQKVASEYLQYLLRYRPMFLTDRLTENFLLHFWNQEPSKRIYPLRKVYVRKKIS